MYFYASFNNVFFIQTLQVLWNCTKDIWPKFQFWNKKGSWKKFLMSAASMSQ